MTAKAQPSRKNNDIEILRAFAILYTIILHLGVLLPAAWTWVIIASVIQLLIIGVTDIQYSLRDISLNTATALGNVMNIYIPYCLANGGGQQCVIDNFLGHYWSLSLEEQFYLVFPFLFFFLGRKSLVILLIAAILAQLLWQRPFFSYAWYVKTEHCMLWLR